MNEQSSYTTMVIAFFLEFLIFLKIFSLRDTFRRLERFAAENEHIAQLFPLFTLWVQILILAHIISLFYHSIAVIEMQIYNEDKTWIQTQNLEQKDWTDKYLHSLYWSVSTMCTIFIYMPETNIEILFVIFSIFLMTGVFGYALNTIGLIITDIDKKTKEYKNERSKANRFFKKRQIPLKLRDRVSEYLHFQFKQQKLKNRDEQDEILSKLSKSLKSEILKEVNKNHIEKFNFLLKLFSQEKQDQIVQIIREESFSPDEFIVKQEKLNSIYIISKGKVEIQFQKDKESNVLVGKQLFQGDTFGIQEFFSGQSIQHTIKSVESCEIIKIERKQFLEIFTAKDLDYEQLSMQKDYYLQNLCTEKINIYNQCLICKQKAHTYNNCNKCTYQPNMDSIVYDYKSLNMQIRRNCQRFPDRTYNALTSYQDNIDGVEEIFDEDNIDQEFRNLAISYQKFYESHSDQAIQMIENKINEIKEKMQLVEEENKMNQNLLFDNQFQSPDLQQRSKGITITSKDMMNNNNNDNLLMDRSDMQRSIMRKSIKINGGGNDEQKVQRLQKRFSLRVNPGMGLLQKRGSILASPGSNANTNNAITQINRRQSKRLTQQQLIPLQLINDNNEENINQNQNKIGSYTTKNNRDSHLNIKPIQMNSSIQKQSTPSNLLNHDDSLNEIIETEESIKPTTINLQQFSKSKFSGSNINIQIKKNSEIIKNPIKQITSPLTRMGQSRMGQSRMGQSRFREGFRHAVLNSIASSSKKIDSQKSQDKIQVENQIIVQTPKIDLFDNNKDSSGNKLQQNLQQLKQLHDKKNVDTWDLYNFDKIKKYKVYMPYNNVNEIIKNLYQNNKTNESGVDYENSEDIIDNNLVDNINNKNGGKEEEEDDQILKQKLELDQFLKKQQKIQN